MIQHLRHRNGHHGGEFRGFAGHQATADLLLHFGIPGRGWQILHSAGVHRLLQRRLTLRIRRQCLRPKSLREVFPKHLHNFIVLGLAAVEHHHGVILRQEEAALTEKAVAAVAVGQRIAPKLETVAAHIVNITVRHRRGLLGRSLRHPIGRHQLRAVLVLAAMQIGQEEFGQILALHIQPPAADVVAPAVRFPEGLFNTQGLEHTRIKIIHHGHTGNLGHNGGEHEGVLTDVIEPGIRRCQKRRGKIAFDPVGVTLLFKHGNQLVGAHG